MSTTRATLTHSASAASESKKILRSSASAKLQNASSQFSASWILALLCSDVLGFVAAAAFAVSFTRTFWRSDVSSYAAASALCAGAIGMLTFKIIGLYRRSYALSMKDEIYYAIVALSIGFFPLLLLFTIDPALSTSRAALISAYVASAVTVGGGRVALHALRKATSLRFPRRIAIAGFPQNVETVKESLAGGTTEIIPIEIDDFDPTSAESVRRDVAAWIESARNSGCGMLLLTELIPPTILPHLLAVAAGARVDLAVTIPQMRAHASSVDVRVVDGQILLLQKRLNAYKKSGIFVKRIFDVFAASLMLLLFSPVMILAALAVFLESGAPVLFRQERVGLNNRPFEILKFRSMPVNVESATGAVWAVANDKRPTKVGAFLRRTSLDELPQIFNVLKGDMSIVGPRPERPVFVEKFCKEIPRYDERHLVRPGITGWSHVHMKRNHDESAISERITYDLFYIDHWSLFMDMSVIFKTAMEFLLHRAS